MALSKLLYQSIFWRGVNLFSVFILNIIIARIFGAAAYGSLFFVINFYALALLIASLSLESGLALYTAKNEIGPKSATIFSVIWSLLVSILIVSILVLLNERFLLEKPELKVYSFLYLAGNLLISFFSALFTSKKHYAVPNIIVAIINIGLCIFLLCSTENVEALAEFIKWFFISFFVQGLLMAIFYFAFYKTGSLSQVDNSIYKKVFRYSLQAFLGNLIFFLVYRVDYWFVNYFVSDKSDLGNYIQVSKLVQLFFVIPTIMASVIFSITPSGDPAYIKEKIQQLSRIIVSALLITCLVIAIIGQWIFPFIFGESFTKMYIPFLLLIPGIIALSTHFIFTAFYAGSNQVIKNIVGSLMALVTIIIGDLLLIPALGIEGAALVSSLGYIVYDAYLLYHLKKAYGIKPSNCFVIKKTDWAGFKALLKSRQTQ